MTDYARRVRQYLRDEYGIASVVQVRHGRHPALEFRYDGVDRIVTINSPGHPDGGNLLALKLQDIRRQLGAPAKREERPKMKLADMLPPATAQAMVAKTSIINQIPIASVRCASYREGYIRIAMNVSDEKRLFNGSSIGFAENEDGSWELRSGGDYEPFTFTSGSKTRVEKNFKLRRPLPLFGISPCEAIEVDGALLLRSDPAMRVPVGKPIAKKKLKDGFPILTGVATGTVKGTTTAIDIASTRIERVSSSLSPRDRMLACLREISAIEAIGTHRLARLTSGKWRWTPLGEVVELED